MGEEEFLSSIDSCFPYSDEQRWKELIHQGHAISDNASFGVLEEICRRPHGNPVTPTEQLRILASWAVVNCHPFASCAVEAGTAIVTGNLLSVERVLELMVALQSYRGQYCALNILYFACDGIEGFVDQKYREIIRDWEEQISRSVAP